MRANSTAAAPRQRFWENADEALSVNNRPGTARARSSPRQGVGDRRLENMRLPPCIKASRHAQNTQQGGSQNDHKECRKNAENHRKQQLYRYFGGLFLRRLALPGAHHVRMHEQGFRHARPQALDLDQHRHNLVNFGKADTACKFPERPLARQSGPNLQVQVVNFVTKWLADRIHFPPYAGERRLDAKASLYAQPHHVHRVRKMRGNQRLPASNAPVQPYAGNNVPGGHPCKTPKKNPCGFAKCVRCTRKRANESGHGNGQTHAKKQKPTFGTVTPQARAFQSLLMRLDRSTAGAEQPHQPRIQHFRRGLRNARPSALRPNPQGSVGSHRRMANPLAGCLT